MIDTLIVVRNNQYGLTRDAELLQAALAEAGVEAAIAGIGDRPLRDRLTGRRRARCIVHVERVFPQWIGAAETNLLVPNQERFPKRHLGRLDRIDAVLAKTREAVTAFSGHGVPVDYLGFVSADRRDPAVAKDWRRILHLAGGSTLKGTEDVLALWQRHPEWPELVLVQKRRNAPHSVPPNVRLISGYVDDGELRRLQNVCGIHLCPSRAEGWGHNLVEGLSCGAVVIATDAPPMNEHVAAGCGIPVPAARAERRHLGQCHFVESGSLEQAIQAAIDMPEAQKAAMGAAARRRYEEIRREFPARVARLLVGRGGARSANGAAREVSDSPAAPARRSWFNRPAPRYLARLYCMLRYGWAKAHAEEWWPHLALTLPADGLPGEIRYRGAVVAPLMPYPSPADGTGGREEVLVVGSGPSLATQAAERLPIEASLLLNGAVHLIGAAGPRPLGVVVEDERFVWRHWRTLAARVPPATDCYFSTATIRALCETAPGWLASQRVHHLDFVHRPYGRRRPDDAGLRRLAFLRWSGDGGTALSLDPARGLAPAGTVATTAAQLAMFLAPRRIGFAGIDLTNTTRPRFYETAGDKAMSRLGAARGKILAAFALVRDESARRGIGLENYSPTSRLADLGIPYSARLEK